MSQRFTRLTKHLENLNSKSRKKKLMQGYTHTCTKHNYIHNDF